MVSGDGNGSFGNPEASFELNNVPDYPTELLDLSTLDNSTLSTYTSQNFGPGFAPDGATTSCPVPQSVYPFAGSTSDTQFQSSLLHDHHPTQAGALQGDSPWAWALANPALGQPQPPTLLTEFDAASTDFLRGTENQQAASRPDKRKENPLTPPQTVVSKKPKYVQFNTVPRGKTGPPLKVDFVLTEDQFSSVPEHILQHALLSKIHGSALSEYTMPSSRNQPASSSPKQNVQWMQHGTGNVMLQRIKEHVGERRRAICSTRDASGRRSRVSPERNENLPCLKGECDAVLPTKSSWVRHCTQCFPPRLWVCDFCETMVDRKERLKLHLRTQHQDMNDAERTRCYEQDSWKVPFFGQCGWCNYETESWSQFYHVHLYQHLKDGFSKEDWNESKEFPPLLERPPALRKRNPFDPPDRCKWRKDDDNDSSNDDDDEDSEDDPDHSWSPTKYVSANTQKSSARNSERSANMPGQSRDHQKRERIASPPNLCRQNVVEAAPRAERLVCRISSLDMDHAVAQNKHIPISKISPVEPSTYEHLETLFQGRNTMVDKVAQRQSGAIFARKVVRWKRPVQPSGGMIDSEIANMRRLSHSHLVQLADYYVGSSAISLILYPLGDLTLQQFLERPQPNHTGLLTRWHSCLTAAVAYLHEDIGLCHLDIKPANIIIKKDKVYLADFGTSRAALPQTSQAGTEISKDFREPVLLTPQYAAPELAVLGKWSKSADVFALGCVFLEMLTVMCHLSVSKFHRFFTLVQKQTQYLPRYASMDIARLLWLSVLKARPRYLIWKDPTYKPAPQSWNCRAEMLDTVARKRPSMKTIARVFMAFSCCGKDEKGPKAIHEATRGLLTQRNWVNTSTHIRGPGVDKMHHSSWEFHMMAQQGWNEIQLIQMDWKFDRRYALREAGVWVDEPSKYDVP
ncbi:MAG: hypothetical protein Q9159_001804 [Coniocarpon cinnabarinum]